MRKIVIITLGIIILLFLSVAISHAQQVTIHWDQTNVASATQAQGFTYKLYVTPGGSTITNPPITLTAVLCGGTAPTVNCSIALPPNATAALVTGAKVELTATAPGSIESAKSSPFVSSASAPTNLRITQGP